MEDHPRVCGKNFRFSLASAMRSGSPPRVREELFCIFLRKNSGRITPACAGRTLSSCRARGSSKDHPRVCGKNGYTGTARRSERRITPACAGRTSITDTTYLFAEDHPRVCGKNQVLWILLKEIMGSPPRVREELVKVTFTRGNFRITPACAGRTYRVVPL